MRTNKESYNCHRCDERTWYENSEALRTTRLQRDPCDYCEKFISAHPEIAEWVEKVAEKAAEKAIQRHCEYNDHSPASYY